MVVRDEPELCTTKVYPEQPERPRASALTRHSCLLTTCKDIERKFSAITEIGSNRSKSTPKPHREKSWQPSHSSSSSNISVPLTQHPTIHSRMISSPKTPNQLISTITTYQGGDRIPHHSKLRIRTAHQVHASFPAAIGIIDAYAFATFLH